MDEPPRWTAEHLSQANPAGPGQDDVPRLLRTVADTLEALGHVDVQDLVLHVEITEDGDRPSITVYFHRSTGGAVRRLRIIGEPEPGSGH